MASDRPLPHCHHVQPSKITRSQSQPYSPSHGPSPFLRLPPELRNKIYHDLFAPASTLTLRSLFIRTHYRNTFMTQQPKSALSSIIAILRVCRSITTEALPILYALPRWACSCRVEALACQIGTLNFSRITRMAVDVDDLDLLVERLQRKRQRSVHRYSQSGPVYAMQMCPVAVPDALKLDDDGDLEFEGGGRVSMTGLKNLDFGNLEELQVEGFQAAALSSRGTHRVRVEALRLCELAMQLLDFHPKLKFLLQRGSRGDGGADARDLTLGRVRWRFVKDLPEHLRECERGKRREEVVGGLDEEHVVDLGMIRSVLEFVLLEDERMAETSLPVAWTSSPSGRFNLYPFLQQA